MIKGEVKIFALTLFLLLPGCSAIKMELPKTLPEPVRASSVPQQLLVESVYMAKTKHLQIESFPSLEMASWKGEGDDLWKQLALPQGKLSLKADAVPLNEFIHMALGDTLKLSFSVDPAIANRTDPVTLHVSQSVKAPRLLGMIEQAMDVYGVGLVMNTTGDLRVVAAGELNARSASILSSKGQLALNKGKVMMIIPLVYASPSEAIVLSELLLPRSIGGYVSQMPRLNALLVVGMASAVAKFSRAIEMIDRPSLKGKNVILVRPVYWKVESLIKPLESSLSAQGVSISHGASQPGMQLIAMKEINALMVISPNKAWTALLEQWVKRLDTADEVDALDEGEQAFVYFARQSTAKSLGATLSDVLGGAKQSIDRAVDKAKNPLFTTAVQTVKASPDNQAMNIASASKLRVVVDEQHNALVFVGSARSYRVAHQLLQQLDRPAKQVLIEATVADITLDASTQLGVEWGFSNVDNSNKLTGALSTLGGLGVGAAGLTYTLVNSASAVRAKLNALASSGKAKILSSPRLLAKDNETARIQVGTQVAVLSQEVASTATSGATTGLLRSFSYVDTGVILSFTPTVTEDGAVQLVISQTVSEAGASTNNTPPISTRNIKTTLVAQSGQSILIGGLITHNQTEQVTKVPVLGDIPFIGHLFSNTQTVDRSTEMVMLITPHVITSSADAEALTRAFTDQLHWK